MHKIFGLVNHAARQPPGKAMGFEPSIFSRDTVDREKAGVGVFLTLTEPTKPMIAEAANMGQHEEPGFAPVPRLQIVTVEAAMRLRERAVQLPARRDDSFRKSAREERGGQGAFEL